MVTIGVLGVKEFPWGSVRDKNRSGGIEKYVNDLLIGWKEREIKFIVYTRYDKALKRVEYIRDNIKVVRFSWLRGFYMRNPSFNFHVFLYLLLTKKKMDKLFVHGPIAGALSIILKKIKNVETIYVPHGLAFTHPQYPKVIRKIAYWLDKINFLFHTTNIFFSKPELEGIRRQFLIRNPQIIRTAIPIGLKNIKSKSKDKKKENRTFTILFVGRLVKVKGWEVLLNSIEYVNKKYKNESKNIEVLIVGEGKDRIEIENKIRKKKIENIRLLGWVSNIEEVYKKADLFVLPSYSEGFPLTLLEACAHNIPIITSSLPLDMDARLTFKIGDYKELGNKIIMLMRDEKMREELIKKEQIFLNKNNINRMREKYYNIFTGRSE